MSAATLARRVAPVLLSLLVIISRAHAQFPSVNDLSPDELRKAIEDAKLSLAAYHLSERVDDWRLISDSGSNPNGLQAAAYERLLPNGKREVVIAFAGSRRGSQADWIIDLNQGTGEGWPASFRTNQRFNQALKFAERYVDEKDKDPNMTLWVVGHSLGGALAQYVSIELGLRATVFDSSALYTKKNDINISLRNGVSRQITQFYLADDPIHPLALVWPFARDYGIEYRIAPAPDPTREEDHHSLAGLIRSLERGHSLEVLISSLEYIRSRETSVSSWSRSSFPTIAGYAPSVMPPPDIAGCRISAGIPCPPPSGYIGPPWRRDDGGGAAGGGPRPPSPPENFATVNRNRGGDAGALVGFNGGVASPPPIGGVRPAPKPVGSAADVSVIGAEVLQSRGNSASWAIQP